MDPNEGSEPKHRAKLEITWLMDGQINVNGCIGNEPISLWMLEKAKDAIKTYNQGKSAEQPLIAPAILGGFPGFPGNGRR